MRLNFHIHNFLCWLLLLCIIIALPAKALLAAGKSAVPVTRGEVIRDVARVTFEWPKPVEFKITPKNKNVSITFERKANPDVSTILSKLYPYVTSIERKPDGKTIILAMDKPYKVRKFMSGSVSGVELVGVTPKKQAVQQASVPKSIMPLVPAEDKKKDKTAVTAKNVKSLAPAERTEEKVIADTAKLLAKLSPAAGEEKQESAPPPQETKQEADDGAAQPTSAESQVPKMQVNKVAVSSAEDSATLRFPLADRTAFSVFTRNHHLWIILEKPVKLDLSEFDDMEKTVIGKPSLINNSKATVLYIPIDDNIYANITKEDNSNNIAILLTQKKQVISFPLPIEVSTSPPAPPHVLVSTLEMADPIIVRDPVIGDELIITPLFKIGEGVTRSREFVEFNLLETIQGITIVKKADDVSVLQLRNGLRITTTKGANISPDLPKVDIKAETKAIQASPTLFPYETWKADITSSRLKQLQALFRKIVGNENIQDSNSARLRMAQIYLSEGLAPEAIALLDGINRSNPSFYRSAKLNSMRGVANFLMGRFVESAKDFAATELNSNKEIDYWRIVLADLLGDSSETYDYLAMNDDYISKYPPVFRQRLAIVAADRAIANQDYNIALKIFDSLHQDNLLDSINVYINFLMAKIAMSTGQEEEATETLDKLADDVKHPFVKARAEFTRIARDMETGLDKDEATSRLERLRLSWHGDNLELKVLTLLGELYNEKKDYVNAMRVWNNGVQSFKNTAAAIDMARKMAETFIIMFNDGIADKLPPLEALALYYEYRNYMPTGTAGNEMIDRLAERLISVDLLEQVAGLLDHQMRAQTEKERRSQIGAKLAAVYILNRQPQKALTALQDSVFGENPIMLRLLRNRLAAEAMVNLEKYDLAMQTLGQDDTPETERIRLMVYWKRKEWDKLTASVENLLKNRQDITEPINLDESEYLIKLALAYVFTDNKEQLQYLRDYFSPLMTSNPNRKLFEFVTSPDIAPNSRNFDEVIESVNKTKSFIESYKARIKITQPSTVAAVK
jgi:tetratricopeptide (TPR) repeat protein